MCDMASFILTKNRVLWHPKLDSHVEILKKYEIKDDYDKPDFVKVEIVPPDNNYKLHIERWEYTEDAEQYYFPEWYNEKEAEKACREELKHWYAERVIESGNHTLSGKLSKIILGGNVTINDLVEDSEIWIYGNETKATINNMRGGYVSFNDNSTGTVNKQTGGFVGFYDDSIGELNDQHTWNVMFYNNSKKKNKN